MNTEVIPAINADSFEEVKRLIKLVEPFVTPAVGGAGWVQLDIADGTFTKNTTWHEPADLLSLKTSLKIEVHLMINDIEKRIENWLIAPINRIIFHLEAVKDPDFIIEKCREAGKEAGIAIGPATAWTQLIPYLNKRRTVLRAENCSPLKADLIQILGVHPGLAGQEFREECFEKIMHLRKECPECIIEVDGGMNKKTAKKAIKSGANIINAATAIFNAKDIKKAIEELKG